MNIELHKHYNVDEIDTAFLKGNFVQIALPTEMVISKPKFCVPNYARAYYTKRWYYQGDILDYKTLLDRSIKDTGSFMGSGNYKEIIMVEDWANRGDDGHVGMVMYGYIFMTEDEFFKITETHVGLEVILTYPMDFPKYD